MLAHYILYKSWDISKEPISHDRAKEGKAKKKSKELDDTTIRIS